MPKSKKITTRNAQLDKTMKRFNDSWNYAKDSWHYRWERDWKLYNNQRVQQAYEGITNTFVPMVFSTVETIVTALSNSRPRFDWTPNDPMQQKETDALNSLLDDFWDGDRWDEKLEGAERQNVCLGTAPLFFYWDIDRPRMVHFSIRDAIVDPTATSPENLGYAGRRYLTTLDELKSYEYVDSDPESDTYGEMLKRFKLPTKAEIAAFKHDDTDQDVKNMFMGSTMPEASEYQVECLEIWDYDRVVTVLNRAFVIEDIENPYLVQSRQRGDKNPKGLLPFVFLRNYTDVSLFYGKSDVEPIASLQERLNDMDNQEGDYIIKQLAPQRWLDPVNEDWLDLINNDPDTVYPFKENTMGYYTPPILPANSFNERMNIKNEIRETTAIDQIAKGAANIKDATATEVKAQLNQASQRIEIKARNLERGPFFYMGQLLFRMIQLNITEPMVVRATGQQSTQPTEFEMPNGEMLNLPADTLVFDPDEYTGDWIPNVTLEIDSEQKKEQSKQQNLQAYQILIQDPTNNLAEIKKIFLPKIFDLDQKDIDAIITPPEQDLTADPGAITEPVDPALAGIPPVPGVV